MPETFKETFRIITYANKTKWAYSYTNVMEHPKGADEKIND